MPIPASRPSARAFVCSVCRTPPYGGIPLVGSGCGGGARRDRLRAAAQGYGWGILVNKEFFIHNTSRTSGIFIPTPGKHPLLRLRINLTALRQRAFKKGGNAVVFWALVCPRRSIRDPPAG